MNVIDNAFEICRRDLRNNYGKHGIYAGSKQYKEYWARDSLFACLGATKLGDFGIVKKNLSLFLKFQKDNGHIPSNIIESDRILRIFGIEKKYKKPKVRYRSPHPFSSDIQDSTLYAQ